MDSPLVSVIIAAYNAEQYIEDCINSIVNQTYTNWNIIICDDSSTDRTSQILEWYQKNDSRIRILYNEKNLKASASRNKCIQNCTGDYIMIQDADDLCETNRIEKLLKTLEKNDIEFVSSGYYLFDDNGIYNKIVPKIEFPLKRDFLYGIPFCHASTMFRKSCLLSVGGYRVDKETIRGQDYDLFMRLYAKGYKGCNIKDVLYGYRVDKFTMARRKFKYRIDECKIRYKGFKELGLLPIGLPYVFKPVLAHIVQVIKKISKRD